MASRCDITDLLVGECAHCRKLPDLGAIEEVDEEEREKLLENGWIAALYSGKCSLCGERFHVGAAIKRDEVSDGWMAECCS